jgi:DNA-binding XRE family transcriptional regulator
MPPREKSVADLMRQWRQAAGINSASAGQRLGLSARTIEDIEQGRTRVDDELSRLGLKKLLDDEK